jgi:hypothetical protein
MVKKGIDNELILGMKNKINNKLEYIIVGIM